MREEWRYLIIYRALSGCQSRDQVCQLGAANQSLLWSGQPPKMFIISYICQTSKSGGNGIMVGNLI